MLTDRSATPHGGAGRPAGLPRLAVETRLRAACSALSRGTGCSQPSGSMAGLRHGSPIRATDWRRRVATDLGAFTAPAPVGRNPFSPSAPDPVKEGRELPSPAGTCRACRPPRSGCRAAGPPPSGRALLLGRVRVVGATTTPWRRHAGAFCRRTKSATDLLCALGREASYATSGRLVVPMGNGWHGVLNAPGDGTLRAAVVVGCAKEKGSGEGGEESCVIQASAYSETGPDWLLLSNWPASPVSPRERPRRRPPSGVVGPPRVGR